MHREIATGRSGTASDDAGPDPLAAYPAQPNRKERRRLAAGAKRAVGPTCVCCRPAGRDDA